MFVLEHGRQITLFNNETGFGARHIDAICDVKASTKGADTRGYIGRKGIGFKSVFTVSDRPHIHSNGYHIHFDRARNGHIGYILPEWTAQHTGDTHALKLASYVSSRLATAPTEQFATCIELPLKSESEMQRHKSSLLTSNFADIKPHLLLFLNKLRRIVIANIAVNDNDNNNNELLVYERVDIDDNLVEIRCTASSSASTSTSSTSSTQCQRWLVMRECLAVPRASVGRAGAATSTEMCLAFPLDSLATTAQSGQSLPRMDTFAYLPLRSFGFTFVVHADFAVPASRQDLNQDSQWNQWLVSHLADMFVRSLGLFNANAAPADSDDEYRIEALCSFLRFVPREEEIAADSLFAHVPRQVLAALRDQPHLIAALDPTDHQRIVWKRPFECVLAADDINTNSGGGGSTTRQVLTADLLHTHLARYYVHPALLARLNNNNNNSNSAMMRLLSAMGVRTLTLVDLLDVLKTIFGCGGGDNNLNLNLHLDHRNTAKWLVVLHHCLSACNMRHEAHFLAQLRRIHFLPVVNKQQLCSLAEADGIFFPFAAAATSSTSSATSEVKLMRLLESTCLNVLDTRALLVLDDDMANAQVAAVLRTLGVRSMETRELVEHILARLDNVAATTPDNDDALLVYTLFLHDRFARAAASVDMQRVRDSLALRTSKGSRRLVATAEEAVYLTPAYGNKFDLAGVLDDYPWCLLDDVYLRRSLELCADSAEEEEEAAAAAAETKIGELMLSWRGFFIRLGVRDMFAPRLRRTWLALGDNNKSTERVEHEYTEYVRKRQRTAVDIDIDEHMCVFDDYECDVFAHYGHLAGQASSNALDDDDASKLIARLGHLFALVEHNWTHNGHARHQLAHYKYVTVYTAPVSSSPPTTTSRIDRLIWVYTLEDNICPFKQNVLKQNFDECILNMAIYTCFEIMHGFRWASHSNVKVQLTQVESDVIILEVSFQILQKHVLSVFSKRLANG